MTFKSILLGCVAGVALPLASLTLSVSAYAQARQATSYYSGVATIGDPVIVDLGVLDRLGPPPNLPQLLRQSPSPVGAGSPATQRSATVLTPPPLTATAPAPAPSSAPQSGLVGTTGTTTTTAAAPQPGAAAPPPTIPRSGLTNAPTSAADLQADRPSSNVPAAPVIAAVPAATPAPAPPAPKVEIDPPKPAPAAPAAAAPAPPSLSIDLSEPPAASTPAEPPSTETVEIEPPAPPAPTTIQPPPAAPAIAAVPPAAPQTDEPTDPADSSSDETPAAVEEAEETQVAALNPDAVIETPGQLSILFDPTGSELPAGTAIALDRLAADMAKDESVRIQLLGYADNPGETASQSRRLSLFRALSVRTYLIKKGVRSTRMDVRALGNKSEAGNANRVDIIVPQG